MIFVTVGTHTASFNRLIRWMDEIANHLDEPVTAQIGVATYVPTHCEYFRFCTSEEIRDRISRARVVVTHGGSTIREILSAGRPVVVVPRLKRFQEHLDDHQLELAQALAQRGLIALALDAQSLETALRAPSPPAVQLPSPEPLIRALRRSIDRMDS